MSDSNLLSLRWREEEDGQWVRKQKIIEDFEAYCYVVSNESVLVSARDGASSRTLSDLLTEHKTTKWMVNRIEDTDKQTSDGQTTQEGDYEPVLDA